jgi:hypothetical protein
MPSAFLGLIHTGKQKTNRLRSKGIRQLLGPVFCKRQSIAKSICREVGGFPARELRELLSCRSVLISCPESEVTAVAKAVSDCGLPLAEVTFVLWDMDASSDCLAALSRMGSPVGSVCFPDGLGMALVEGDEAAYRLIARLLKDETLDIVRLKTEQKAACILVAAENAAACETLVRQSLQRLKSAGLKTIDATRYVRQTLHKELRKLQRPRSS